MATTQVHLVEICNGRFRYQVSIGLLPHTMIVVKNEVGL